jgi:hypothetical protein
MVRIFLLFSQNENHGFKNIDLSTTVEFRIIVFRPFKGEILEGKIVDSSPIGIRSTLEQANTEYYASSRSETDNISP